MFFKFSLFLISLIFNFFIADYSRAALLYMDQSSKSYGVGDTFMVKLRLDNEKECINAADIKIKFSNNLLRAVDFSRGESIFTLWIGDPLIDNEKGYIYFSGGIPAGYCGRIEGDPSFSNIIGKIVFTVPASVSENKNSEKAFVRIVDNSQVLLNDGFGTPANLKFSGSELNINPKPILFKNEWLDQLKNDNIPPEKFSVILQKNKDINNGRYYVLFSTNDKQSGLDYFEVFENGFWKRVNSPYILNKKPQIPLKVRAIDKAGNERVGDFIIGEDSSQSSSEKFNYYFIIIALAAAVGVTVFFLKTLRMNRLKIKI